MTKNLLAVVGIVVLARKGYELYSHYKAMKDELAFWRRKSSTNGG